MVAEFCSYCGASIPHRVGEGRCTACWHHDPEFAKERIAYLEQALSWIADASERPVCLCGLPTGTAAIKSYALRHLKSVPQRGVASSPEHGLEAPRRA